MKKFPAAISWQQPHRKCRLQLLQEEGSSKSSCLGACKSCSALKPLESLETCYVLFRYLFQPYGKFGYLLRRTSTRFLGFGRFHQLFKSVCLQKDSLTLPNRTHQRLLPRWHAVKCPCDIALRLCLSVTKKFSKEQLVLTKAAGYNFFYRIFYLFDAVIKFLLFFHIISQDTIGMYWHCGNICRVGPYLREVLSAVSQKATENGFPSPSCGLPD